MRRHFTGWDETLSCKIPFAPAFAHNLNHFKERGHDA